MYKCMHVERQMRKGKYKRDRTTATENNTNDIKQSGYTFPNV